MQIIIRPEFSTVLVLGKDVQPVQLTFAQLKTLQAFLVEVQQSLTPAKQAEKT